MNMPKQKLSAADCDHKRIEQFLNSEDFNLDNQELIEHLDHCESCREYIQHQAGAEGWRLKTSSLLKPTEFDQAGTQEFSAASSVLDSARQPLVAKHVLEQLPPSEFPNHLGRLGTYEVTGVVGVGGMGVVLKAIDPSLDRVVAIKVMNPRLANNEKARKRFAREAKAAAAILHPNVIPIHSVSSEGASPYLVMAYIRGGSLQTRLQKDGPLPLIEVLRIGSQIAAGLSAAHDQGLVHRDIKPENILLEEGVERVTITDFGLARAVDDNTITQHDTIAGTPMYMSPEQARGQQLDQTSDLFSLGSVLYALCTGRPPFLSDSSYGVMRQIIDDQPQPLSEINPTIPNWFTEIVDKLMSKDREHRFSSAAEVQRLLEACLCHLQQPNVFPLPAIADRKIRKASPSFVKSKTGVFLMTTISVATAAIALIVSLIDRPTSLPKDSSSNSGDVAKVVTPDLSVENFQEQGSDAVGKTFIRKWKLNGQSVGLLTMRVLYLQDGKSRVVSECSFQGGKAEKQSIEIESQLEFLQPSSPGPGKVIRPSISVSVNGLQSKSVANETFSFAGSIGGNGATIKGQLMPLHILTHSALVAEGTEYTSRLDSMLAASMKGSFLVTVIDWRPTQDVTVPPNDKSDSESDVVFQLLKDEIDFMQRVLKNPSNYPHLEKLTSKGLEEGEKEIKARQTAIEELKTKLQGETQAVAP